MMEEVSNMSEFHDRDVQRMLQILYPFLSFFPFAGFRSDVGEVQ